jgi:hypothetical protein
VLSDVGARLLGIRARKVGPNLSIGRSFGHLGVGRQFGAAFSVRTGVRGVTRARTLCEGGKSSGAHPRKPLSSAALWRGDVLKPGAELH